MFTTWGADTLVILTQVTCTPRLDPERARSCLISEAKQGRTWLVLGWETNIAFLKIS